MASLKIRVYPDPVLKGKTEIVTDFGPAMQQFFDDMIETMFKEDGVGLAAPQVGRLQKITVIAPAGKKGAIHVLVNPEIYKQQGSESGKEGCLSFPGLLAEVFRAKVIRIRYQDRKGKKHDEEIKDFFARVIQHEVDHLNGILLIDRVDFNKRQELLIEYQSAPGNS